VLREVISRQARDSAQTMRVTINAHWSALDDEDSRESALTGLASEIEQFVDLFSLQFDKLLNEVHEEKNDHKIMDQKVDILERRIGGLST
jgi:hypothetical protein